MTLTIIACLAGISLGLTCNIAAMLAVIAVGTLVWFVAGTGGGFMMFAAEFLYPAICLQLTYMIGLTARDSVGQIVQRVMGTQSRRA